MLKWKMNECMQFQKKQDLISIKKSHFRKMKLRILEFQFNQHFSFKHLLQEHVSSISAFLKFNLKN